MSYCAVPINYADGTEGDLFVYTEGYFEGYAYDVFESLESLDNWLNPPQQTEEEL